MTPDLRMVGPDFSEGPLPALFYFALSAEDSLGLDPFNQPVTHLKKFPLRIFSLDLPAHGPNEDKMEAMAAWSEGLRVDPTGYFEPFFFRFGEALKELSPMIIKGKLMTAGLSRGGFIAAHLAARFPEISAVMGFSPAAKLLELNGFPEAAKEYDLVHLIPRLVKTKIKFYIGNHDIRVGTSSAFEFCKSLADYKFQNGERSPGVEFSMYPSIGHKGHGTPPAIFTEGAEWAKSILRL